MKNIPVLLLEAFKKPGRSTCFLVKIVERTTGVATGFSSLDCVVPFNDGIHDLVYDPDQELRPQNIESTNDMEVDNTELVGWFDEAIEKKVVSGMYDSAEITIYRVSYLRLELGAEVVAFGLVGEVDYSEGRGGKRSIEYRSLTQLLKQKKNDQFSLTCRLPFGSDECGMPFEWFAATVDEVADNFLRFKVTGVTQADDYFNFGMVMFDDGPNATFDMEVESWTADGWVTLSYVTPYGITDGTAIRIRRDCGKRDVDCKAYGNIINMQAENLTPVENQALMVPGAYIKSQNAL